MEANGAINPGDLLKHRYQVVRSLGKGGFGQTFEVLDLEDRGSRKVLKVLLNLYPKAQELFKREAEVLQKLDCPGIPKVERDGYFTIQPAGSQPLHCLVMEYVGGQNLLEWLEQHQAIDQDLALDWLKQLVEILGLLHDRDYFHRDIKPENIMRKPDGQLVLIDFGAVRPMSDTYFDKMSAKQRGTAISSAGYCAPEQADGLAVPESDFFSLGRTFVHLLTGQHPCKVKRDPKNDRLLWRVNAPQVSSDFADLIDDLMTPFRWQRPQLTQIIYRLERIEAGLPIISPLVDRASLKRLEINDSPQVWEGGANEPEKSDRPVKRKNKLKIAVVVGLLSFGLMRLASPQIAVVCNKQGVEHHRAKELFKAEFYYRVAVLLKQNYAKVHYNLGVVYQERNDRVRAIEEFKKSIQGGVAPAYNNLARLYILEKKCDEALSLLHEGLALADSAQKQYPLLLNLGRAMLCQHRYPEALDYLQEAIALDSDRSAAHCLMPPVLDGLGDRQGARIKLEQCPTDAPPELNDWLRQRTREGLQVAQNH